MAEQIDLLVVIRAATAVIDAWDAWNEEDRCASELMSEMEDLRSALAALSGSVDR